jgi:coenzyme Q-binding protein COQ10
MAKHVVDEPNSHEIFIVGGDVKGTHITEKYEQTPDGTRIVVTVDFKPKGSMRLGGIFGKIKVENEFSRIMDELILIAEH